MAYGVLSRDPGTYPAAGVVFKMLTVEGYNMGDLLMDPAKTQAGIAFVKDGVRAGKLKPTVAKSSRWKMPQNRTATWTPISISEKSC